MVFPGVRQVAIDEEFGDDWSTYLCDLCYVTPDFEVLHVAVTHVESGSGKDLRAYRMQAKDVFRSVWVGDIDGDEVDVKDTVKFTCGELTKEIRQVCRDLHLGRRLSVRGIEIFEHHQRLRR
jgi:hypothetical protein